VLLETRKSYLACSSHEAAAGIDMPHNMWGRSILLAGNWFCTLCKECPRKNRNFIKELNPSLFLISQTPLLILRISGSEGLKQWVKVFVHAGFTKCQKMQSKHFNALKKYKHHCIKKWHFQQDTSNVCLEKWTLVKYHYKQTFFQQALTLDITFIPMYEVTSVNLN
jgi:hypothetical protein